MSVKTKDIYASQKQYSNLSKIEETSYTLSNIDTYEVESEMDKKMREK